MRIYLFGQTNLCCYKAFMHLNSKPAFILGHWKQTVLECFGHFLAKTQNGIHPFFFKHGTFLGINQENSVKNSNEHTYIF